MVQPTGSVESAQARHMDAAIADPDASSSSARARPARGWQHRRRKDGSRTRRARGHGPCPLRESQPITRVRGGIKSSIRGITAGSARAWPSTQPSDPQLLFPDGKISHSPHEKWPRTSVRVDPARPSRPGSDPQGPVMIRRPSCRVPSACGRDDDTARLQVVGSGSIRDPGRSRWPAVVRRRPSRAESESGTARHGRAPSS
jgi:hypothetical protein